MCNQHPAVIAAFLAAFSHMPNMRLFSVLELDTIHDSRNFFATKSGRAGFEETPESWTSHHSSQLEQYNISVESGTLSFVDHDSSFVRKFFEKDGISCGPEGRCLNQSLGVYPPGRGSDVKTNYWSKRACENEDFFEKKSHEAESTQNWAEQMWKVHKCGELVDAFEQRHGRKFDYILKWRPDSIFFGPFPPLPKSKSTAVFAVGGASSDWYFLCARDNCNGFFVDATQRQLDCTVGPDDYFGFRPRSVNDVPPGAPPLAFSPLRCGNRACFAGYFTFARYAIPMTLMRPKGIPNVNNKAFMAALDAFSKFKCDSTGGLNLAAADANSDVGPEELEREKRRCLDAADALAAEITHSIKFPDYDYTATYGCAYKAAGSSVCREYETGPPAPDPPAPGSPTSVILSDPPRANENAFGTTMPGSLGHRTKNKEPQIPPSFDSDEGVLVMLVGGARTVLCTFPKIVANFLIPLNPDAGGADLFALLKFTDPGPKGQKGYDFRYADVDPKSLQRMLGSYPHVVGSIIVPELNCTGTCLTDQVACGPSFAGWIRMGAHLERSMALHAALEVLGKQLRLIEATRGRRYAVVAWSRPDVLPRLDGSTFWPKYTELKDYDVADETPATASDLHRRFKSGCNQDGHYDVDSGLIFPRIYAEFVLMHPMEIYRTPCNGDGTSAITPSVVKPEQVIQKSMPHPWGCLGTSAIRTCEKIP